MKKLMGMLVLAFVISMAGVSHAAENDFAFEQYFANELAPSKPVNDYAFEQAFAAALASPQKPAHAVAYQSARNKFENDDKFVGPFTAAFAASWDEIAAAMRHKVVKNGDTSHAAYAYTVIGMLKRGVNAKGGAQILNKELARIGYATDGRLAMN